MKNRPERGGLKQKKYAPFGAVKTGKTEEHNLVFGTT